MVYWKIEKIVNKLLKIVYNIIWKSEKGILANISHFFKVRLI